MMCNVDALKSAALQSHTLLSALVRHEQTVYAQASQSAACMATHHVEARLCRWLLRARDLADTDNLQFTQEFLAEMLGVRRTSVTLHARSHYVVSFTIQVRYFFKPPSTGRQRISGVSYGCTFSIAASSASYFSLVVFR